jgi:hypothetical protein
LQPFVRRYVKHRAEAVAYAFVVSPERERITEFLRGREVNQIEKSVLGFIIELLEDPRFHLRSAVSEGDLVEIVFNHGFTFSGGLPGDARGRSDYRDNRRRSRRRGRGLRLGGPGLGAGSRRLRTVFLKQRLEKQNHHEGQYEDEKQSPLVARLLLRILKVSQI